MALISKLNCETSKLNVQKHKKIESVIISTSLINITNFYLTLSVRVAIFFSANSTLFQKKVTYFLW